MTDVLEFKDISQEIKGAMYGGRLKLSKQGVAFKNNKTGKVDQVHAEDMETSKWLKVARGYELKLYTNSGSIFKYDGFKDTDKDRIGNFIKNNFDLELEEREMSYKGWNWGKASFTGSELSFAVDKKTGFHVPLGNVSHSTTAKNEVILEFHPNDDAEVSLMEMRFYIPPTEADPNPIEEFHEKILAKADIIQATGDALCSIEQIPCLTPRGRYDIKLFPTFLQLHGKTFDYKISYTTVLRLFLLPHKDNRQMYFILSLDPPIVQGQTRYHFLILSFQKEDTLELELNVSEEDLEGKYQGKLQKEMSGASFEIISRLLKSLTGRKITIPGSFNTIGGAKTISCSHKSNSGFLYPLERGFMYVHKPPIHIRFDEIACVNFSRGTGSTTRYFDFEIEVRNGTVFVFSSIDKNEYTPLFDFVSGTKKLRVKNRGMKGKKGGAINYDELMDSDDEGDHDAYMEAMKREGREKDEEDEDYVMNDDSDESDEDFDPDIGEASDVELEYDSNASESSDSDGDYTAGSDKSEVEEGELKRKKHKESKKPKKKVRTVSEKPRRPRRKKKEEDPNKPKRAPSAYMMWMNLTREEIKSKVPEGSGVADVGRKAGELWNEMEVEEKARWQDKASEAKKEYQKAMTEYTKRKEEEGVADEDDEEEEQGTPKKKEKKKKKDKKKTSPSPKKSAGSGTNYKSKEYISSESSSDDSDDKALKPKSKGKKKSDAKVKKEESEKEESEKEESEKEESEKEESEKEESAKGESEKEESEKEESAKEESEKEESEKEESEKEASEAENEASGSEAGSD